MSNAYELIVFDWDGTLMDSVGRIVASLQAAAADLGLEILPRETMSNVIGLGLREAISKLYPDFRDEALEPFADRYRHHFLDACPYPETLFDGAHELLGDLRQRSTKLAVATGKSRKGLDRVLDSTGCGVYFDATRCADETCSKPDPRMLHEIMEQLGVSADKTLMVGDSEYDMEMAQRAGVPSLAVSYGVHGIERLKPYQPIHTVDSLVALGVWLENNL